MRKVFLYLYPVKEYPNVFTVVRNYIDFGYENPFSVLNECIQKRYRQNGYEIIFVKYPDKEIYGIDLKPEDKVIETDVTFDEAVGYTSDGNKKPAEEIKYPSEEDIFTKVGNVDEIVVGGYHYSSCVKRIAEYFYRKGVYASVDLELTDIFFTIYHKDDFNVEIYSPSAYKQRFIKEFLNYGTEFAERQFSRMYDSPTYHFDEESVDKKTK